MDVIKAILYELQPVRWRELKEWTKSLGSNLQSVVVAVYSGMAFVLRSTGGTLKNMKLGTAVRCSLVLASFLVAFYWGGENIFKLYLAIMIISLVYIYGLDRRVRGKGELSAFSVFNDGFQRIAGTFDADQIDRMIRGGRF
jgi:hypothetical protein